jgi:hypothetical protein
MVCEINERDQNKCRELTDAGQEIIHPELLTSIVLIFRDMHPSVKNDSKIAGLSSSFRY